MPKGSVTAGLVSCLWSYTCDIAMHVNGDVLWHGVVQREVEYCDAVKGVTRVGGFESVSLRLAMCMVKAC